MGVTLNLQTILIMIPILTILFFPIPEHERTFHFDFLGNINSEVSLLIRTQVICQSSEKERTGKQVWKKDNEINYLSG